MAIDRAPWTALVDDDGSNLTGSIWNKAAIKTVLLDPIDAMPAGSAGPWKNATGVTIRNDGGTVLTTTFLVNRYRLLGGNTIAWNFAANPISVPAVTGNLYLQTLPFTLLGPAESRYPVAWTLNPAYLKFIHGDAFSALRADGANWIAGSQWLYFNIVFEASGG